MRILHTADWHLGKRLDAFPRLPEQETVMAEICQIADSEKVDLVLVAGDLFDNFNPGAEASQLLYKTLRRLCNHGQRPVIAIAGNHDSPERIEAADPLAKVSGIFLVGEPFSDIGTIKLDSGIEITHSEPAFISLKMPNYDYPVRVLLAPFASEMRLKEYLGQDGDAKMREILQQRWADIATRHFDEKGLNLMIAHFYLYKNGDPEPEESEDERSLKSVGNAQPLFTENLPNGLQYAALGHLHRQQTVDNRPCPVVYSSSPLSYSFSEADQDKYVMIIDAEPGKPVAINKIKLKSGKRLLRYLANSHTEAVTWLEANQDALVEISIKTAQSLSGEQTRSLLKMHNGIVNIIPVPENYNAQTAGKSSFVDLNESLETLFTQYYANKTNGQTPSDSLLSLFREVINHDSQI